jgi:Protein of unknown function (DUF1302)
MGWGEVRVAVAEACAMIVCRAHLTWRRPALYSGVVCCAWLGAATVARAETFTLGDAQISLDTTLSAGFGIRTEDPNPYFLDPAHGGTYPGKMGPSDLNWKKGAVFQAPLRGTNELQIDDGNYTVFVRATYLFDPINSDPNNAAYQPLPHDAVTTVGHNFRLLDGFVRGKYNEFDQNQSITLGWQTFNWGESLFFRNGLNAVNPIDVAGIHAAGADIRSLYFPVPAIDLRTSLPAGFSVEAFWEFSWAKSQLDPFGTFFSTDVSVTPGASAVLLPPKLTVLGLGTFIPRTDDKTPSEIGNFGVALRKSIEALDDAQFGLYFENFGARFPVADFTTGVAHPLHGATYASTTSYYADYPNNVQYVGATLAGDGPFGSALQGEISYSPNTPLQLNPLGLIGASLGPALNARLALFCRLGIQLACEKDAQLLDTTIIAAQGVPAYGATINGYKRFGIAHVRISDIASFPGIGGTPVQSWSLSAEYGMDVINDFPSPSITPFYRPLSLNSLNAGDAAFFSNGVVTGYAQPTQVSEGVVTRAAFSMPAVIGGVVDVNPSLAVEWDFQGTTPAPLSTFDDHLLTVTVGINFSYLQRWNANIGYTSHYGLGGSARESVNLDRDYVACSVSYRF